MTSYSIPSELSPQNIVTPTVEDYPVEVEPSDWESKMAKLVGLEESATVDIPATTVEESTVLPSSQPEETPTEQPLSSNPFAKLALVGSATLAVVLISGVFLSQMMSIGNQKPKNNDVLAQTTPLPTNSPRQPDLQQEVETLKTKLALAEQAETVTKAQQNLRNATTPRLQVRSASGDQLSTTQARIPTPVQTVYVPRTVTVERIVPQAYPQQPYPQQPTLPANSLASQPSPPPLPVVNPETPPSPPDPLQEWTKLAKLGSYGQVNSTVPARNNAANVEPEPQPTNSNTAQEQQPPADSLVSQAQPKSPKSVAVGTSVKAVLATAVFGETTRSRGNEKDENANVFVVRLKQPLKAVDGAIALPANTELLTEIRSISEQGLLQLNVVKLISQNNGNLTETSLPNNALVIRGSQGKPLIATKYPNQGSSIASMDAGLFVLGGLSKAAELLNRNDGQVVTVNGGSTVVSTNTTQRNLFAGVAEGGLNSIVPQISQRNQQAIAQFSQQTNVWFVAAGKEVEIYVNQTMQF